MAKACSEEVRQAAKTMRDSGMQYREIAKALSVSIRSAHRFANPSAQQAEANYREEHAEEIRERHREYRKNNPERIAKAQKKYYSSHKEKIAARAQSYAKSNPEKVRASKEKYRLAHKEKYAKLSAEWRKNNRELSREIDRAWSKAHPEKRNAKQARRNAKKREAFVALSVGQKAEIERIYDTAANGARVRCYLCGEFAPKGHRHVDHIVPLARGGEHRPSNLAVACDHCNCRKGAKLPEEIGLLI